MSMRPTERARIEALFGAARQLADALAPLVDVATDETDVLCLRLAQAHAYGLLDQLGEITQQRRAEASSELGPAPVPTPPQ